MSEASLLDFLDHMDGRGIVVTGDDFTLRSGIADFLDPSEIVSVDGVHPRCDTCGKAQQPEDDWNGETGNHLSCEKED